MYLMVDVFSGVEEVVVSELVRSLYSGDLGVNEGNFKTVYKFGTRFGIEWITEIAKEFFTKSTIVSSDMMKFGSYMFKDHSDDFILEFYLAKLGNGIKLDVNFFNKVLMEEDCSMIDVSLIFSIAKNCNEDDVKRIAFLVKWCEANEEKVSHLVELIMHAVGNKEKLFKHPGALAVLATQFSWRFGEGNLLNFCTLAISEFGPHVLSYLEVSRDHASIDNSLILALCENIHVGEVESLQKLLFIVKCCRVDQTKIEELAKYIFVNFNLELYKYVDAEKVDIAVQFLDLVLTHGSAALQTHTQTIYDGMYERFILTISNSRELNTFISSDKWGKLKIELVHQLFEKFQHELDSITMLGGFRVWAEANSDSLSKELFEDFLSKFRIEDLPARYVRDFAWSSQCKEMLKGSKYLDSSGRFELFAEVDLPLVDKNDFDQDEARSVASMATFKRSSGQFTQGSRIMRIKSGKRNTCTCIRLGFDTSRAPYMFKYPITRKASISQGALPLADVSKDFVTIYGLLKGKFINLPFTHPDVLEDLITTARAENEKFVFVVFSKSNSL